MDDLSSWKDSPRDCHGLDGVAVGFVKASIVVNNVIIHTLTELLQSQSLEQFRLVATGNEKLQVSLLEHEPATIAPTENLICL